MDRPLYHPPPVKTMKIGWNEEPSIAPVKNQKQFVLKEQFSFTVIINGGEMNFSILPGFVFDGASIPRPFKNIIGGPIDNLYTTAALIHDILYAAETFPRKVCDQTFPVAMKTAGVPWWRRTLMYLAVRVAGGIVWRHHTETSIRNARKLII